MTNKLKLRDNFYIAKSGDKFFLHNFETREMFELDANIWPKIFDFQDEYAHEFEEAKVLCPVEFEEIKDWTFDTTSRFFYNESQVHCVDIKEIGSEEWWQNYLEESQETMKKIQPRQLPESLEIIALPEYQPIQGNFHDLLKSRRTIREFSSVGISLQAMSDILFVSFGRFHAGFDDRHLDVDENFSWRRSSPSSGGMNSVDAYVFVHRVGELTQGTYYYDGQNHKLHFLKPGNHEKEITPNVMNQNFGEGCAFVILTVGDMNKIATKYNHPKGLFLPHLDNGHIAQTAILASTALNLEYWLTAGICDEYFRNVFNLVPYQTPMMALFIGHGQTGQSLGPKIHKQLADIKNNRMLMGIFAMQSVKEKVTVKLEREKDKD